MGVVVTYVAILAVGVVAIVALRRSRRRRLASAQALAIRHGFQLDTTTKPPPPHPFDLFDRGGDRRVEYHMWRAGGVDSVFHYRYTTGSGDNRSVQRFSCALIRLPFVAPHTMIGPENFLTRIGRSIGFRDIEIESPEFNHVYRVRCDDERFAITLLDHNMIGWLLRPESGRGSLQFEMVGPYLLVITRRLDLTEMFGFHDWAQEFPTNMPAVLTSLYPVPQQ